MAHNCATKITTINNLIAQFQIVISQCYAVFVYIIPFVYNIILYHNLQWKISTTITLTLAHSCATKITTFNDLIAQFQIVIFQCYAVFYISSHLGITSHCIIICKEKYLLPKLLTLAHSCATKITTFNDLIAQFQIVIFQCLTVFVYIITFVYNIILYHNLQRKISTTKTLTLAHSCATKITTFNDLIAPFQIVIFQCLTVFVYIITIVYNIILYQNFQWVISNTKTKPWRKVA